jgi:hypothetical protein
MHEKWKYGESTYTVDQNLAIVAAKQHGVVTVEQLEALGIRKDSRTYRTRIGRLHRLHNGVYAVGHTPTSFEGKCIAAVFAAGEGAALSHLAAARLWNVWEWHAPISVVAEHRRRGLAATKLYRTGQLLPRDVAFRDGIAVTSIARTLLDLGDVLSAHKLGKVIHQILYSHPLPPEDIEDVIDRNPHRRAITVLRKALGLNLIGSAGTRSSLEELFLNELARLGVEMPLVNVKVKVNGDLLEVDFLWKAQRLVVEVDGSGHARLRNRIHDRRRNFLLEQAGYRVLRVTPGRISSGARQVAKILGHRVR